MTVQSHALFLLLLCGMISGVADANYFTDAFTETFFGGNTRDENYGSLRIAVLLKGDSQEEPCDDALFPEEFYDGLTHAVHLAVAKERQVGPPRGGPLYFPSKRWDDILHHAKQDMNHYGLIWQHHQGRAQGGSSRRLSSADVGPPDNFCMAMKGAAVKGEYLECACTAGRCDSDDRRMLKERKEQSDTEQEALAVVEDHQGQRQLKPERKATLERMFQHYRIPILELSQAGQDAASAYIVEMKADGTFFPTCFKQDVEPIVFIGMALYYTE